ncbi:MAG: IPT/TIG domain-containing protein, partial [Planctomycetota bacterium]
MLRLSLVSLLCVSATAQSFQYLDFLDVSRLSLLGNAAQFGAAVRLTDNVSNQSGWMWHDTQMPVVAGFDTTFEFRITPPVVGTKAEGMALVLQDDPAGIAAMGGTVWGMGYGAGANGSPGLLRSIAIELDTFQDGFLADTSSNELTIHTNGAGGNREQEAFSLGRVTPATNLSDGLLHTLRVRYVPGTLDLFVDGAVTPALTVAYDFEAGGTYANGTAAPGLGLTTGGAWVGFCATTGAGTLTERVEFRSWSWSSTALTDLCYAGTLDEDVLTVDGLTGGLRRVVQLPTHVPFSIEMAAPSAVGPGAPWVLVASLLPNPGAPGTNLGFGSACMPMAPLGFTELVLADGSGLVGGALPAGLAPFTLQLPVGAVSFPLEVTLQAVILADVNPFELGLTNAIDLEFRSSPAPAIQQITPLSAAPGTVVTVNGTGFLPGATLAMNGAPIPSTLVSSTRMTFPYPAGIPCSSQLTLANV